MNLTITHAVSQYDLEQIRALFIEYHEWLGVNLRFQGFYDELEQLEARYDRLLLARLEGEVCGCVGLWPAKIEGACEMKRLFVRGGHQGRGVGRRLALRIIEEAQTLGYPLMVLDTLERLQPAIKLYEDLGFTRRGAYYDNPLEGVVYMEKALSTAPR